MNGAPYFCQPVGGERLVDSIGGLRDRIGDVKIVVAALAKISFAPVTRGNRLVSNVTSAFRTSSIRRQLPPGRSSQTRTREVYYATCRAR